jgi:hypothetical protein
LRQRTGDLSGKPGEEDSCNANRRIFDLRGGVNWRAFCSYFGFVEHTRPKPGDMEVTSPKAFTSAAILVIAGCGVLLVAPVLVSLLAVTVIKLGMLTVVIPLLTIAGTAYFLPFGLGNPIVRKLVRSQNLDTSEDGFIVQMTLSPRIRSGLRALVEDADDLGFLSFTNTDLVFKGDSVRLRIPWRQITEVRPQNIGWRGRYLYGSRIRITVVGIPNVEAVTFSERSSLLLPASKRNTRKLRERICAGKDSSSA